LGNSAEAQQADDPASLIQQIDQLRTAGKLADALALAERLVALTKSRNAESSLEYAEALHQLAATYFLQSRHTEAEPIFLQVLAIRERALGPGHESVLTVLDALAALYQVTRRPQLAEPLLKRVLAERERGVGPEHPSLANTLRGLAEIQSAAQRYGEAETHIRRALALYEKSSGSPVDMVQALGTLAQIELKLGRNVEAERTLQNALSLHENVVHSGQATLDAQYAHLFALVQLSGLYQRSDRYKDAVPLTERAVAMTEKLLGPEHPNVATGLENLAAMRGLLRRFADAEAPRKRAISINERAYGKEHPNVAESLRGLGHLYRLQNRFEEALPLLQRGLSIAEKALGADHPRLVVHLTEIAELHRAQGRYADAEALLKRALANIDKPHGVAPEFADTQRIQILQSLAFLSQSQGRRQDARPLLEAALAASERLFGADHSLTGDLMTTLAFYLLDQDQTDEAERYFERALPISERAGREGMAYSDNIAGLGLVHFKRKNWAKAYSAMKHSSTLRIAVDQWVGSSGSAQHDSRPQVIPHAEMFLIQAVTAFRLAASDPVAADALRDEAFQIAQRAQNSQAAAALGLMAARFSTGIGELANLVRERQDLSNEWRVQDARLTAEFSALPAQRKPEKEQALRSRLAGIAGRLDTLDGRLAKEFPEYTRLASPQPLSIARVQELLASQEALVLIASRLNQSLVWVITKERARWELVPLGEDELGREVAALRCGLDASAWALAGSLSCELLLGLAHEVGQPLPFDLARAHGLYAALLAPFHEIIKDKRLLIVPSGPLTGLPFSVLVTEAPASRFPAGVKRYADVAWLAKSHATAVLPSVTSLASLRGVTQLAAAPNPFIGFGNPLLSGADGRDRSAWAKQTCPKERPRSTPRVATVPESFEKLFRGNLGHAEALRRQSPLPETAAELCAVARDLGARESEVLLGSRATETAVKTLSDRGELATYRILHFATHGLLAGETESFGSGAEPALLLTPPDKATEADDGLLTASEVAHLKLNAEWVVLSACNTAGGTKAGAQPLSGLARAFFYAGARSLLVSHWYVESEAAVKVVTGAFAQAKLHPSEGRAEAVRRAMLALLSGNAHPATWAPFVVVGEGIGQHRELPSTSSMRQQPPATEDGKRAPSTARKVPTVKKPHMPEWNFEIFPQ
jgi:CHAT domain-containing protein